MSRLMPLRLACCVLVAGCGLLDVNSPTVIEDENIANAQGAELQRVRSLQQLYFAAAFLPLDEGLLTDEFFAETPSFFTQFGLVNANEFIDRRDAAATSGSFQFLHGARNTATLAMRALRPVGAPAAHIGQMFSVRGFAKLLLAQDFCSGQAFNEIDAGGTIVFTPALTTEQAFQSALQDLDSAVVHAADSVRILNFARVARARVLLELGRFAEAATAAAPVPTSYVFNAEYSSALFQTHSLFDITNGFPPNSVADGEGGTGLDYVSAGDPRVPTQLGATASDGVTNLYSIEKYPTDETPIPLVTGIEARLIEAEAALQAGNTSAWLTTLNELRATAITPAMSALTDPGNTAARVDLHFRERAFWLFATAHRLGDLRRLVRQYGRTVANTFPAGPYRLGGTYGAVTTFDIPATEAQNPAVTGCTSR